jgi:hypothetical protein
MFHIYVATVCSKYFICSSLLSQQVFVLDVSFETQTYVAFKCFILHVFHAIRRVRGQRVMVARHGRREWRAVSWWAADMARGALVAGGRVHDGVGRMDGGGVSGGEWVESRQMGRIASESYGRRDAFAGRGRIEADCERVICWTS